MQSSTRIILLAALSSACTPEDPAKPSGTDTDTTTAPPLVCVIEEADPDFSPELGCWEDFDALASVPLDASIPGARSVKTVLDQIDGDALYFQNSRRYPIHWEFASAHLSGDGLPLVPDLGTFNLNEYYSPDRRFILGAITFYEEPEVWAYEVAPYDTASGDMVTRAYRAVRDAAYFGDELFFHPSSLQGESIVPDLGDDVAVISTDELFDGITYQPLNLGSSMGLLSFYRGTEVDGAYVNFREITVLDAIPNDISITAGIITGEFQTPLSHINVLSQNRGTPNMSLKGAYDNEELRALEGKWVELTVEPFEWSIREVTPAEAEAWWQEHKPDPLEVTPMDTSITTLTDDVDILDLATYSLADAIPAVIPAYGGKASHYGGLAHIGPAVPVPKAFVVPMHYYNQFMTDNGFWDRVDTMLADPEFHSNPAHRAAELESLQLAMRLAPLDPAFETSLTTKMNTDFPGVRMRFRSSTNAEDLGTFTGAGLYTSKSGDPNDPDRRVDDAVRTVWASVWGTRAYEEREYYSIDHTKVGMALLVHRSFPDEEANGVAITANIFDTSGLEPGFYVNVQIDGHSVVLPDPGIVSDQFVYYFDNPGQPIVYIAHSNLVLPGETVLDLQQTYDLGVALAAIRDYFYPVYGTAGGFYGMDTEFKFDGPPGQPASLFMKQARPYPGWDSAVR